MPSARKLEAALIDATREIFRTTPEQLSVNAVRKQVEANLGLEAGFFKAEAWKPRSKRIIESTAAELDEEGEEGEEGDGAPPPTQHKEDPLPASPPPVAEKASRANGHDHGAHTTEKPLPSRKRKLAHRKVAVSSDNEDEASHASEGDADGQDDGDFVDDAGQTATMRKKARRGDDKAAESPLSEVADNAEAPVQGQGTGDDESEMSDVIDVAPPKRRGKKKDAKPGKTRAKPAKKASAPPDANDSDSSLSSVVVDDAPPKRKKAAAGKHKRQRSSAGGGGGGGRGVAKALSPDDAEIKKLQGQLVKCGVRKIWGVELKGYGDDTKAKIRHLHSLLHDVGMDGRFSEAKAHEIKERRELLADLEAVQEMDHFWGATGDSGGRTRRKRSAAAAKSFQEPSTEDEDEGEDADGDGKKHRNGQARHKPRGRNDDSDEYDVDNGENGPNDDGDNDEGDKDDEDDGPKTWAARRRSARNTDLAFLGSESESDPD